MRNMTQILREIDQEKTIYIIEGNNCVIGPYEIFQDICGLFDLEYGWPKEISELSVVGNSEILQDSNLIFPSYRCHPFISSCNPPENKRIIAISINEDEFEEMRKRHKILD